MVDTINIGLYLCESVRDIETEVIYDRLTKGKNNFTYDTKFRILESIEDVDNLECIIIVGLKDEVSRLNYNNLKNAMYGNFIFIIDKFSYENKLVEYTFNKINNYILVEDKEKLIVAVKSFLDFIEKLSHIDAEYELSFGNTGSRVIYFDEIKICDMNTTDVFKTFENIQNVVGIIYLYTNFSLVKLNEVMMEIVSNLSQDIGVTLGIYECLDIELEKLGLFICTSIK